MLRSPPILQLSLCAALGLAPAASIAAPPPADIADPDESTEPSPDELDRQRAIEAFRRGTDRYAAGDFEAALEDFEEAATLYASPDFQFNIARCYEHLRQYEEAILHYETYLRTVGDTPDRAVVESTIAELRQRVEDERLAAEAKAKKDAEERARLEAEAKANKRPPGRVLIISGGVFLGVGAVAALAGGLGFGIPVATDNKTLGRVLDGNPDGLGFAEVEDTVARAQLYQTVEFVMIGAGSALVITGAVLLGVGMSKKKRAKLAQEQPGIAAHLRVSPSWVPNGAGLTIGGRF